MYKNGSEGFCYDPRHPRLYLCLALHVSLKYQGILILCEVSFLVSLICPSDYQCCTIHQPDIRKVMLWIEGSCPRIRTTLGSFFQKAYETQLKGIYLFVSYKNLLNLVNTKSGIHKSPLSPYILHLTQMLWLNDILKKNSSPVCVLFLLI